jgi:prepilin-type N-terminal cleavage/methylation domain-containing protein
MRRKQNKGFTLAELLIVVAIIAVLVAISIPIFTAQLKKARLAANKANARAALSAAIAEFIDAPEEDKKTTINDTSKHMYFRYDTKTGQCTYEHVGTESPGRNDIYKSFANIGHEDGGNGKGISDVSKWDEKTTVQVKYANDTGTILTDRTYRYWDVAMQGDGTFTALVCLWK